MHNCFQVDYSPAPIIINNNNKSHDESLCSDDTCLSAMQAIQLLINHTTTTTTLYFWRTHQLGIHANADIFRIQCAAVAQENKDKKCGVKLFCQLRMGSLMLVAAIRSCWTTTTYLKFETFGSRNALNVRLYNYKITHIRSELPDRQQYAEATKRFCWGAERDTGRRRC